MKRLNSFWKNVVNFFTEKITLENVKMEIRFTNCYFAADFANSTEEARKRVFETYQERPFANCYWYYLTKAFSATLSSEAGQDFAGKAISVTSQTESGIIGTIVPVEEFLASEEFTRYGPALKVELSQQSLVIRHRAGWSCMSGYDYLCNPDTGKWIRMEEARKIAVAELYHEMQDLRKDGELEVAV